MLNKKLNEKNTFILHQNLFIQKMVENDKTLKYYFKSEFDLLYKI